MWGMWSCLFQLFFFLLLTLNLCDTCNIVGAVRARRVLLGEFIALWCGIKYWLDFTYTDSITITCRMGHISRILIKLFRCRVAASVRVCVNMFSAVAICLMRLNIFALPLAICSFRNGSAIKNVWYGHASAMPAQSVQHSNNFCSYSFQFTSSCMQIMRETFFNAIGVVWSKLTTWFKESFHAWITWRLYWPIGNIVF